MAFTRKVWKDRIAEYINRRTLTKEDGSTEVVTVAREEGTVSQEGDAFSAKNMNNLEERIGDEFDRIDCSLNAISYMPDYDSKVQLTSRVTYTAPKDGILVLIAYLNGWAQSEICGILFFSCTHPNAPSGNTAVVQVPKGTDIYAAFENGGAYFVPYK